MSDDEVLENGCTFCDGGRGNILPECPECGLKYNPLREIVSRNRKTFDLTGAADQARFMAWLMDWNYERHETALLVRQGAKLQIRVEEYT